MMLSLHNKRFSCFIFVLVFTIRPGMAQDIEAERLFELREEGENSNELLDYLLNLQQQPLDLNLVTLDELQTIPWISRDGARAILEYRRVHRKFLDVDELESIAALEPGVELIKTFFMVKQKQTPQIEMSGRHRLVARQQKSRGYTEDIYNGNFLKVYNKLSGILTANCKFAFITEKDAGEKSYYDFTGGYGQVFMPRLQTKIVAGNYIVESGQGLVHRGAYQLSKGYEPVLAALQPSCGIKASASVDENAGCRGGALLTRLGSVEGAIFFSTARLDARVENDTIATFQNSGYHRYGSEIQNRDAVTEKVFGNYIKWPVADNFYLGAQWLSARTGKPFIIERPALLLNAKSYYVYSMDYGLTCAAWQLFGECAQSNDSAINHLHGLVCRRESFEYLVLWRKYQTGFFNRHGSAFGESSDLANEAGIYTGWKWRIDRKTTLAFYYDQFKRPFYTSKDLKSLRGTEVMGMIEHKFTQGFVALLRLQVGNFDIMQNVPDNYGNPFKRIIGQKKVSLRAQVDVRPQAKLQIRTRFEYHHLGGNDYGLAAMLDDSSAVVLYHDLHYKISNCFFLRGRWTIFDSPLYDTAFYLYENDLPGAMRVKMLNHRGSRWYILSGLNVKKTFRLTVKYEYTLYDNVDTIGSGYDLVKSNHDNLFSLQIDWNL